MYEDDNNFLNTGDYCAWEYRCVSNYNKKIKIEWKLLDREIVSSGENLCDLLMSWRKNWLFDEGTIGSQAILA